MLRRSEFVFDYVRLLYRKYFNVILNCGGSYIDSPNCTKNKKATINPINEKDNKRFQYAVTIWLYQEEIGKNPDRITKVKPFINKYQWKGINFPSEKNDWKIFEKNNVTIALNVLYAKKEKIYPAYVWKHNSNREKQVFVLMISNGERLLGEIMCKLYSEFIVWIAFILSQQKKRGSRKFAKSVRN